MLALITVVTLRYARLVPGWVTVFGQVNHLGAEPGTQVYSAGDRRLWVGWIHRNILQRPLKVIKNGTVRYSAYDFLLLFHIVTMALSSVLSHEPDVGRKLLKKYTPSVFSAPVGGDRVGSSQICFSSRKTRMIGVPRRKESVTTC